MRRILSTLALSVVLTGSAWAEGDEIVVTAQQRLDAFEDLLVPHVNLRRRADFLIVEFEIRSDTRDLSQRRAEIEQALRGLETKARGSSITLAIVDEETDVVRPFSMGAASELIRADRRADTSLLTIRLRTAIGPNDSLEILNRRIEHFLDSAPKPGRIEMETGEAALSLIEPEQYRPALLREITADGRRIAEMLGPEYGLALGGLERQVAWRRSGDLELTLFIAYSLSAERR